MGKPEIQAHEKNLVGVVFRVAFTKSTIFDNGGIAGMVREGGIKWSSSIFTHPLFCSKIVAMCGRIKVERHLYPEYLDEYISDVIHDKNCFQL